MNQTLKALSEVIKQYPLDEKLLFVPSYSIGHQIGESLARSGASWINLRISTPLGYAQGLLAHELAGADIRLADENEELLIVEKLYKENPKSKEGRQYFEAAEEISGILKCLTGSLRELKMAGVEKEDIDPGAFINPQKAKDLIWLYRRFDQHLKQNRLIDQAGLLKMATQRLEKDHAPLSDRIVIVLSDFPFTNIEKNLINLVGGKDLVVVPQSQPVSLEIPVGFFQPPAIDKKKVGRNIRSNMELLPWLFNPETAPGPLNDQTVSIFSALGESNEVREVFRRILKLGIPFDDVELLVTALDPYISVIHEIAQSLDVPVTFSSGIPISYSRPGKALLLYLQWQEEDFSESSLRRLLSGGYLDFDHFEKEQESPSFGKAASFLREAAVGWGKERYIKQLNILAESYQSRAKEMMEEGEETKARWIEAEARKVGWLARYIEAILGTLPKPDPECSLETKAFFGGCLSFVARFCRTVSEIDGGAKSTIKETLQSLIQGPSFHLPSVEISDRLREIVSGMTIASSLPQPGSVHVAHYSSGGYSGRPNTFILGLDQSRFPGALLQDPVLLDKERGGLKKGMVLSHQRLYQNTYSMARVLGSVEGRVTLGYSCRDLKEDREIFPSHVLLNVYRLISGDRKADYGVLINSLGAPSGFIPRPDDIPLNDWEWWLKKIENPYGEDSVLACYPNLQEGERAEKERAKEVFGEYDGFILSARGVTDPANRETILSCKRLEELARCPYAFFIRYLLGIEPLEEREKDMSRWLHPLERGELLHEVFRRFMEEVKARGERPSLKKHFELLNRIASEEIEHWKEKVPLSSELAYQREVEDLNQTLQIFLKDEEERSTSIEPCLFELSFGISREAGGNASTEEPVAIRLKGAGDFRLRGKIDRIDQAKEHQYEVWDYKTGSTWGYSEESCLNRGKQLQHALYAIVAETLLRKSVDKKAKVVRSGYSFPTPKGNGTRYGWNEVPEEELSEVLGNLFQLLREGMFPATYDGDMCKFCDYPKICGGKEVAVGRVNMKMEQDQKIKPLKRLKEYE